MFAKIKAFFHRTTAATTTTMTAKEIAKMANIKAPIGRVMKTELINTRLAWVAKSWGASLEADAKRMAMQYGAVSTFKLLDPSVKGVVWGVTPADQTEGAVNAAEARNQALFGIYWPDWLTYLKDMGAPAQGWAKTSDIPASFGL